MEIQKSIEQIPMVNAIKENMQTSAHKQLKYHTIGEAWLGDNWK